MNMITALVGAGRMGTFVGRQLPADLEKIVIDTDEAKAKGLAETIGATYSTSLEGVSRADVIAVVLPAPVVKGVIRALAPLAKDGAIILDMATESVIEAEIRKDYPNLHFVDAKIIGHANSMMLGAPGYMVIGTQDQVVFDKAAYCMPGYEKKFMGDPALVPVINKVGAAEGIRTAVQVRKLLKQYNIPKEWEDIVIYTVCAGTMRSYVEDDLGEFARNLIHQFENEA